MSSASALCEFELTEKQLVQLGLSERQSGLMCRLTGILMLVIFLVPGVALLMSSSMDLCPLASPVDDAKAIMPAPMSLSKLGLMLIITILGRALKVNHVFFWSPVR